MNLVTPALGLIFWQTLTFLIVLFLLSRFAWKPIMKALKDREASITDKLAAAEQAKQKMEAIEADNAKLLDEARIESNKIIKAAQQASEQLRQQEKEKTEKEIAKMLDDARKQIQSEKQAAVSDMKTQIASFSLEIAEKVLRKQLENPSTQQALVTEMIDEIKLN